MKVLKCVYIASEKRSALQHFRVLNFPPVLKRMSEHCLSLRFSRVVAKGLYKSYLATLVHAVPRSLLIGQCESEDHSFAKNISFSDC